MGRRQGQTIQHTDTWTSEFRFPYRIRGGKTLYFRSPDSIERYKRLARPKNKRRAKKQRGPRSSPTPTAACSHRATLAPKEQEGARETREHYYRTQEMARAAERASWASYHAWQNRMRAAQISVANDPRYANCNRNEQEFLVWSAERQIVSHRAGWPDFLTRSPTGKLAGVEVKSPLDFLSPHQIQCFRLLEEAGVPVFVWRPDKGLRDWKDDVEERPSGGEGAEVAEEASEVGVQERSATRADATPAPDDRNPSVHTSPRAH